MDMAAPQDGLVGTATWIGTYPLRLRSEVTQILQADVGESPQVRLSICGRATATFTCLEDLAPADRAVLCAVVVVNDYANALLEKSVLIEGDFHALYA